MSMKDSWEFCNICEKDVQCGDVDSYKKFVRLRYDELSLFVRVVCQSSVSGSSRKQTALLTVALTKPRLNSPLTRICPV